MKQECVFFLTDFFFFKILLELVAAPFLAELKLKTKSRLTISASVACTVSKYSDDNSRLCACAPYSVTL